MFAGTLTESELVDYMLEYKDNPDYECEFDEGEYDRNGPLAKRINLCGATPHVFRHTYITLAASSGMDVKTLQSIAGHSDIKMTLDRYAHERENNIISAGSLIGDVFRSM